jgi:hypothetical protein
MNVEDFVATVRAEHVDALVRVYEQMFTETPLIRVTDGGMRELTEYWQSTDSPTRAILASFLRLGSQASVASLLAVLDNTSSVFTEEFSLLAKSSDGVVSNLSEDLLDTFWAQEEAAGHVNRKT